MTTLLIEKPSLCVIVNKNFICSAEPLNITEDFCRHFFEKDEQCAHKDGSQCGCMTAQYEAVKSLKEWIDKYRDITVKNDIDSMNCAGPCGGIGIKTNVS